MSNRTWACVDCGKTYRRDQYIEDPVVCGLCNQQCEFVHWKIHVPSPKKSKEWSKFWELYRREKSQLTAWCNDSSVESVHLDILNMCLISSRDKAVPPKKSPGHKSVFQKPNRKR